MKGLASLALLCLTLVACWGPGSEDSPANRQPTVPPTQPPHIISIEIPDWPPLGPGAKIAVTATAQDWLRSIDARFRNLVTRAASGSMATVSFTAEELGSGLGTLVLTAHDTAGRWARREVSSLLVDLEPPKIHLGKTVLRHLGSGEEAELRAWVSDGWVLGWVELSFQGTRLRHEFPSGYPSTLGTAWDYSLVTFPAAKLPPGAAMARMEVSDAAGNKATRVFELKIDGDPPLVSILSPAPGTVVEGTVEVSLSASDPGGGRVWIELSCGGGPPITMAGPNATVLLHADDYVQGALELEAVAVDEAGNRSAPSSLVLTIP